MIDIPMRDGIYLYMRWKSMIYRCEKKVRNYGKLNISVCDEWKGENGFRNFEEYTLKTGRYIPTYRMSQFMAAADKVVNVILRAFPGISYYEMKIILKIVQAAIRESKGVQEDDL